MLGLGQEGLQRGRGFFASRDGRDFVADSSAPLRHY